MTRALPLLALIACAPGADRAALPGAAAPPPVQLDVVARASDPDVAGVKMVPLPTGEVAFVHRDLGANIPDLTLGVGIVRFVNGQLRVDAAPIDVTMASGLALGDVDQDGDDELLVRGLDAVTAWDPVTWQLVRRIPVISLAVEASAPFAVGQGDADPEPELITGGDAVRVYDLDGRLLSAVVSEWGAIVQADTDPQLEVARRDGTFYDVATGDIEPAYFPDEAIPTADVTGDGVPELVARDVLVDPIAGAILVQSFWWGLTANVTALREPGGVGLYTPMHQHIGRLDPTTWTVATGIATHIPYAARRAIAPMDVNGDGVDEVLLAHDGGLALFDTQTGDVLGTLAPRTRVAAATADVDGDGLDEVLVATHVGVEVRDGVDLSRRALHPLPDLAGMAAVRGAGPGALAWRTTDGALHLGAVGPAGVTSQATMPGATAGPWALDASGDGADEVFAVINGQTCALRPGTHQGWCMPYSARHVAAADVDRDGRNEVVVQTLTHTYVLRAATGAILAAWASPGASLARIGDDVLLVQPVTGAWRTARVTLAGPRDPTTMPLGGYSGLRTVRDPAQPANERWIAAASGNVAVLDPVSGAVEIAPAVRVDAALAVVVRGRLWLPTVDGGWSGVDL